MALAADFSSAPLRPDWGLTGDEVTDVPNLPHSKRHVQRLHKRLPITISASLRYFTRSKRIMLSNCWLSSAANYQVARVPKGALAYGADLDLDPDALEAASRRLAATLETQEGYVDATPPMRKAGRIIQTVIAVHGCGDPAVLLQVSRYEKPLMRRTWSVGAKRRSKAPAACAAR
ncbi:hypothetical protein ACQ5SO_17970 [Rhodovulum sp. DZ06]|uniref:hypothetical protein n=1 Tax=Rhodovulum sp. DZ06 TaxID=3425126 RepID=UPI003D32A1A1